MRFNYTMMGDSVNLAARCESGGKSYGVYTMITETTLQAALAYGAELNYRKLDCVVVKGRHQPVELYELWESSIDHEATAICKEAYEAALAHYFEGDWAIALAAFEASEMLEPSIAFAPTTPSAVLAARCRQFIAEGGPENWDGAFTLTSK
jgi:adenylate cyclase